jgi:GntP family gluconate:H+ symporter
MPSLAATIGAATAITPLARDAGAAAPPVPDLWPFGVLVVCVVALIVLITRLRVHAFIALVLAATLAGILSRPGQLPGEDRSGHWIRAVELTTEELGKVAGNITIVIVLASVIGMCLMESGAADKVVRRFLAAFGPKRAGVALLSSSYVLSIPIFFDTFVMLLLPLAKALRIRTGKDYVLYVMAICASSMVTHSMVVPHPGPVAMAGVLGIDLGASIGIGILAGVFPVACGWVASRWINRRMDLPLRETAGAPLEDLEAIVRKPEEELPPFVLSILPIILPIALISSASFLKAFYGATGDIPPAQAWLAFLGERNVALFIACLVAMGILVRQRKMKLAGITELIGPPLETAGVIILITSAGGAFGFMLKNAGVGEAIRAVAEGHAVDLVVLSYAVACVIRVAQGSATVAMLTTSAMMLPFITDGALPFHPIYLFLSIGFGAMVCSWMNDSGFWVVSRLSGMTEKETLKGWTVVSTVCSVAGFVETLILSRLLPLVP